MITKMKKLTFLVTSKEYEQFLADIRQMGVVHIEELQSGATSPEFEHYRELADRYANALKALDFAALTYTLSDGTKEQITASTSSDKESGLQLVEEIESLLEKENALKHDIDDVNKQIALLEPWGDFDTASFEQLRQHGYQVDFFACPSKMFKKEWADDYYATPINEIDKKIYFVTFAAEHPDITAETIQLPLRKLSYFIEDKKQLEQRLDEVRQNLLKINAVSREKLIEQQVANENEISLSRVHLNTESVVGDAVKLLVGWLPVEKEHEVTDYLESHRIFYEAVDPTLDDDVPVEIKNDSYSSLFEPILKMYSLPNYHDLDVTPFLAPFFMLFFGLCMGDAGYGAIILAVAVVLKNKLPETQKPYAKLGIWLGIMTMVCGTLTGSFFGIDLTQQDWAFLAPIKDKFINENNFRLFGYSPMMVISVIIGLVQVLLGMVLAGIKAAKLHGWVYGVGKFSWVVALLSTIACFGLPACGVSLSTPVTYILYGLIGLSVLGIFLLNSPDKNIFMNFATGIWDTYSMATGLLGDLLSYIRLFALGLTGGVLGGVFNSLAIDMTSSMSWAIRWLPMLIILLFGHGINFALCMISSFVHPMRLTFVEFFKNANFEGGGKAYDPFRVKTVK